MRNKLCLSSFGLVALLLSGCVTVPNTSACSVAGLLKAGSVCGETLTDKTYDLDFAQTIDMLEPKPERPDPDHAGQTLPARAGAIFESAEDYGKNHTALEQACRALGKRCSYEIKQAIQRFHDVEARIAARIALRLQQ